MNSEDLLQNLFKNADENYKNFHSALLPNISKETLIGVRVPLLRKMAKEFFKESSLKELEAFLDNLPHKYFEENQIHLMLIEQLKDFDKCLFYTQKFLPYIDNWAVCDGKCPKALLKNKELFLEIIYKWLKSSKPYTVRFAVNQLMDKFLDENFSELHLKLLTQINPEKFSDISPIKVTKKSANSPTDRYYVQMVIAWYLATALAKQWDITFPYIQNKKFPLWIHNKAIQKAKESYRITKEQKEILQTLKI